MTEHEANAGESNGWELLDWQSAVEHPGVAGGFFLVVRGVARAPMEVELHPLPIGVAPVDYHPVQVRGRTREPTTEVETPWTIERDPSELPHGRKGYKLVGATMHQEFPPKEGEAAE